MSASLSYDVTVNVATGVQAVTVDFSDTPTNITIEETTRQLELIELESGFNNLVYSVNDLQNAVVLTYTSSIGTVSPVSGVYTYTINHNLGYSYPMVIVYNDSNQLIEPEIVLVNSNSIQIKSLIDLNNYRVVVQR